jgi:small subunit ribosomal protein S1
MTEPTNAGAISPTSSAAPEVTSQEPASPIPSSDAEKGQGPEKTSAAQALAAEGRRERRILPGRPPSLEHEQRYGGHPPRIAALDAEIERELEEAMGGLDASALLTESPRRREPSATSTVPGRLRGTVLSIHGPDVFVDVPGGRSQGVLPLTQFPEGPPAPGTEVEITIEGYDRANGLVLLSRRGAAQTVDWSSVAGGMIVEALVTATNKGGLEVQVSGIRGFMPISQIDLFRVENPEQYINQRLNCEVVEVDPDDRKLVVSRRIVLEREREENREKLWQDLAEGQIRTGVVRSVRDFGAFIDLGGVDGLLHISEMSWVWVKDAAEVVKPGQTLKVVVLKIDREHRKLSLSLKQLMPSPWDDVQAKYPPGSRVKGKVTRIMDFGAFVELEPAVEGLIHVSELSPQRVRRVIDVVKPDQEVEVLILSVDPAQRRISLSLKAALAQQEEAAVEEDESEEDAPPPKPRTTPLRGGIGDKWTLPEN